MKLHLNYVFVLAVLAATGCQNARENNKAPGADVAELRADSIAPSFLNGNTTQRMGLADTSRKFVITADLKFRVKDAVKATYAIEKASFQSGGFITNSELRTDRNGSQLIKVSADSSLEITRYITSNNMLVRLPKHNLDRFLSDVGEQVDLFDYRIIKADDVGLEQLSNVLAEKRNRESAQRREKVIDNTITGSAEDITDLSSAEDNRTERQRQADEAMLENLLLNDKVEYATLSLNIYQREFTEQVMLANPAAYRPPFGARVSEALNVGWVIIEEIVLFFVRFWSVIVLAVVGVWVYRRLGRRKLVNG